MPKEKTSTPSALIVEPGDDAGKELRGIVRDCGLNAESVNSKQAAVEALEDETPDVLLLATDLPDGNGLDLLIDDVVSDRTDVVVMHDSNDAQFVSRCMRLGADEYVESPVREKQLRPILERYVSELDMRNEQEISIETAEFGRLLGNSRAMLKVYRMLHRVAATNVPVMLIGESGTGKERAAASIHMQSARAEAPFVPVNCGAIPRELTESQFFGHVKGAFTGATSNHDGYFRQAHGGTLFLDELAEMDADLQVKLLRALETGSIRPVGANRDIKVDVRIVAATNRDPEEAIEQGLLREDLWYRLAAFPIRMPPLRNRGADVLLLAQHFLTELAAEHGREVRLTEEAADWLRLHDWPGNVRELKNAITRAYILSDTEIEPDALPEAVLQPNRPRGDLLRIRVGESIAEAERKLILATLDYHDNDRTRTAKELGISVKTLYNRMKEYEQEQGQMQAV